MRRRRKERKKMRGVEMKGNRIETTMNVRIKEE